jgi:hypothetical protein
LATTSASIYLSWSAAGRAGGPAQFEGFSWRLSIGEPGRRTDNKVDQFTYRAMTFHGMAQAAGRTQYITIAPPFSLSFQILSSFQFSYDSLHGALRNADARGHIAEPPVGLCGQAEQDMPVVREEGPSGSRRRRILSVLCLCRKHTS